MGAFIYQWIDLIWLPVGWFAVHKRHRILTVIFVLTCIVTMRTQIELMETIGYGTGILPFMDSPLRTRGLLVYGTVIALFLVLAHYSPRTREMIYFAAALTVYLFTFCLSMVFMVL